MCTRVSSVNGSVGIAGPCVNAHVSCVQLFRGRMGGGQVPRETIALCPSLAPTVSASQSCCRGG